MKNTLCFNETSVIKKSQSVLCKVVWSFRGLNESIPDMNGKSRILCKWWVRVHIKDSQYAAGTFRIVPIVG